MLSDRDEVMAMILDVLRANRLHQSTCSLLQTLRDEQSGGWLADPRPACDCWLSEPPPGEARPWSLRDLIELAGDPGGGVRVDEYRTMAATSRRYTWPDGRVRRFDRPRGEQGWVEVADQPQPGEGVVAFLTDADLDE